MSAYRTQHHRQDVLHAVISGALALTLGACSALPDRLQPSNWARRPPTPTVSIDLPMRTQAQLRDFDAATRALRERYLYSKVVNAEWDNQALEIRKKITERTTDEQYFDILLQLVKTVNDNDVTLSLPTDDAPAASSSQPFVGIGVSIDTPRPGKNRVLVLAVFDDSPAARAGIKPHDAILRVGGRPVNGEEGAAVVGRLRGEPNSQVVLTVQTPNTAPREVTVTRRAITSQMTTVARHVPGTNYGYILPSVSVTPDAIRGEVTQAMRKLSDGRSALDGLVLDLRLERDPKFPLADMLNLFGNGHLATQFVRERKGNKLEITGKNVVGSQDVPLVILIGDMTSGPAETFAGILQSLGRAKVVGNPSRGKVAIMSEVVLSNSGLQLNIPNSEYRSTQDKSWLAKYDASDKLVTGGGVQPDVKFERTWEEFTDADDPHLQKAIELLKGGN